MTPNQQQPVEGFNRSSTLRRLLLGIGANAVGKFWIIAIQLLSVPILVTEWGTRGYGIWLMLTALPVYIALSDFGFGSAGAVDMTRRIAIGDRDGALAAFQSVWLFVSVMSGVIFLVAAAAWLVYRCAFPSPQIEIADAALLLTVLALFVLQMTLVNIAYRSLGRYAEGTFYLDLVWPVENIVILVAAVLGGSFVAAAAAMVTVRTVSFAIYYFHLHHSASWIRLGWSHASLAEIRALAKPALGAMALPLATAMNIQGVVFIVGVALSPAVAAMFGTARTISRVPIQVVGMLTRASLPEITIAHTRKEQGKLDRLIGTNLLAVALISVPAAIATVALGPYVLSLLSRGSLTASVTLFLLMTLVMLLQILWNTIGSFLTSLNLQHRFAYAYTVISVIACVASYFSADYLGVNSVLVLLICVDAFMTVIVIAQWNVVSGARWVDYFRSARSLSGRFWRMCGMPTRRS